jgi:hypothetical protein
MLTSRPPFTSDNPVEVILQVLERDPDLLRTHRPDVPRELEWICLKCLEKNPADRYATAAELGDDLERFLRQEPVEARSPTPGQRFRRWMRRAPVLAWHLIGLGVPLAVAQLVFALHPARNVPYHLQVSGVLVLWMIVCGICQWLLARERTTAWAHYFWSGADALFLTALLSLVGNSAAALRPALRHIAAHHGFGRRLSGVEDGCPARLLQRSPGTVDSVAPSPKPCYAGSRLRSEIARRNHVAKGEHCRCDTAAAADGLQCCRAAGF